MNRALIAVGAALVAALAPAQQANHAYASMVIDGNNGPTFPMTIAARTSTTSTMAWTGTPSAPFILVRSGNGNLQPGGGFFGGDICDLPLNPPYQILADGLSDTTWRMSVSGQFSRTVAIPPASSLQGGLNFHESFQSIVADPTAVAGYHLTAATRVNLVQGPNVVDINLGDESILTVQLPSAYPGGFYLPFFGVSYSQVSICSNGYLLLGSGGWPSLGPEWYGSLAVPQTEGPRIFGMMCDMDTTQGGTERYIIDLAPPTGFPYFRVEFNGVGDFAYPAPSPNHHTFAMQIDDQGDIALEYAANCAPSSHDTMVGITDGNNNLTPRRDLLPLLNAGVTVGAPLANFWDWYGDPATMPHYPQTYAAHPFNLAGHTIHFHPTTSGTLTPRYAMY